VNGGKGNEGSPRGENRPLPMAYGVVKRGRDEAKGWIKRTRVGVTSLKRSGVGIMELKTQKEAPAP